MPAQRAYEIRAAHPAVGADASSDRLRAQRALYGVRQQGKRSSALQKSITYKLATYWEGWKAGRHVAQFGLKQIRVRMLTSSEERMRHMLGVVNELTQGRGSAFFLFAHAAQLSEGDPRSIAWTSGRRQPVWLTD